MRAPSTSGGAIVLVASLLLTPLAAAHEYVATVTLAEGQSILLAGTEAVRPAAGVWVHHCDIVDTGADGFVQLEIDDGGMIELAPSSRLVAHLPAVGRQAPLVGPQYLLAGWAKVTVPKRDKGLPHRIDTPLLSLVIEHGIVVVHVAADSTRFFVESGEAAAHVRSGAAGRTTVRAGSTYSITAGSGRGNVVGRAAPDFVKAMPRTFLDTLRPRLKSLKTSNVTPRSAGDFPQEQVRALLAADDEIRVACARRH